MQQKLYDVFSTFLKTKKINVSFSVECSNQPIYSMGNYQPLLISSGEPTFSIEIDALVRKDFDHGKAVLKNLKYATMKTVITRPDPCSGEVRHTAIYHVAEDHVDHFIAEIHELNRAEFNVKFTEDLEETLSSP